MDSPKLTDERDFLFLIEIKNQAYYQSQAELISFLKVLPDTIRIYAVIHAGMNTLKVYCVTKSQQDYASVAELTGSKTEVVDTLNFPKNDSANMN
jgi:hypothetical protein